MASTRIVDDPARLAELLDLLHGVDGVELKVTVPDSVKRSALHALGIDPLDAEIRQIYFFDTPDLALNKAGVVVRVRRTKTGDDTVVKLRPVVPRDLSAELRSAVKVEVDVLPGGFVCSASYRGKLPAGSVKQSFASGEPLRKLFTKAQRAFFADNAPDGIQLDDLTPLGPIPILKAKFVAEGFDRPQVAELWLYPDGSNILELSTKCEPETAFQVAAEARVFLAQRGIEVTGEQQTKTATALKLFAAAAESS